jgi:hypothetical protein
MLKQGSTAQSHANDTIITAVHERSTERSSQYNDIKIGTIPITIAS